MNLNRENRKTFFQKFNIATGMKKNRKFAIYYY